MNVSCRDGLMAIIIFFFTRLSTEYVGKDKHTANNLGLLSSYIYIILVVTVFGREEKEISQKILIPFWSYLEIIYNGHLLLLLECLLNVIMFIPFGIFLKNLRIKAVYTLLLAMIMSYLIEFLQLVLKRGLFEWFDDPFHNVMGALIGFGLCGFIRKENDDTLKKKE